MTRAALSARVSSDDQTESQSIPDQLSACRAAAEAAGHEIIAEAVDPGISGAVWPRPGLARLLDAARRGEYTVLWLWDYSRLARDDELHGYLRWSFRAAGVTIATVCDPGARPLEIGLHAIIAGEYRRSIRAAVIRALSAKASRGEYNGGTAPTGYRWVDGKLEVHPLEADRIRRAVSALELGGSANGAAATLGITPNHAGRLLRNPALAGAYRWGQTLHWEAHEPIVDRARWERLQALLDGRRLPQGRPRTLALSGLLRCPCGGTPGVARISRPRHLSRCYRYACPRCGSGWTTRGWVESILARTAEALAEPDLAGELAAGMRAAWEAGRQTGRVDAERARLDRAERAILDLASDGTITADEARSRLAPLRVQRASLPCEQRPVRLVTPAEIRIRLARIVGALRAQRLTDPDHEGRAVLRQALEAITPTGRASADLLPRWGEIMACALPTSVAPALPGGNSRGRLGVTRTIPWSLAA